MENGGILRRSCGNSTWFFWGFPEMDGNEWR
jgi:hypothetical protein